jgi:hypothetical protein
MAKVKPEPKRYRMIETKWLSSTDCHGERVKATYVDTGKSKTVFKF